MRSLFLFSIMSIFGLSVYGQEIDRSGKIIPREPRQQSRDVSASLFSPRASSELKLGHFRVKHFSLPDNLDPSSDVQKPIDILAISEAQERYKQSHIRQSTVPMRQIEQINSKVNVFHLRRGSWNRANDNLHFYGKNTPDGGIKNEAIEDIRQPYINPYYRPYGRNYELYNNSRPGFYFYRR